MCRPSPPPPRTSHTPLTLQSKSSHDPPGYLSRARARAPLCCSPFPQACRHEYPAAQAQIAYHCERNLRPRRCNQEHCQRRQVRPVVLPPSLSLFVPLTLLPANSSGPSSTTARTQATGLTTAPVFPLSRSYSATSSRAMANRSSISKMTRNGLARSPSERPRGPSQSTSTLAHQTSGYPRRHAAAVRRTACTTPRRPPPARHRSETSQLVMEMGRTHPVLYSPTPVSKPIPVVASSPLRSHTSLARWCSPVCSAVTVAGVSATNQFFSAVTTESAEFVEDPTDGILGLAFPDISNLGQVRISLIHAASNT